MNTIQWVKCVLVAWLLVITNDGIAKTDLNIKQKTHQTENIAEAELTQKYTTIEFHSKTLDEVRKLLIYLPNGYLESESNYPVTYILDGNRHFSHAINATQLLEQEEVIPPSIIVAITNNQGTRQRDLSRGKEHFQAFITNEVMPLVETRYRTSKINTLFGHSMAGAFTLYMLATKANLFDNYIAASPVIQINDSELLALYRQLSFSNFRDKSLYLTMGQKAVEGKSAIDALNAFLNILKQQSASPLNWHFNSLPNQIHMTTPYLTLFSGLTHVYSDFRNPSFNGLSEYQNQGEMQGITAYYQQRAIKYAVSPDIPERTLRTLGFSLFDDGHQANGLEILKLNLEKHPDSIRAMNALAQTYEDIKQPKKALELYKNAFQIAKKTSPRNEAHFKRQVERLSQ